MNINEATSNILTEREATEIEPPEPEVPEENDNLMEESQLVQPAPLNETFIPDGNILTPRVPKKKKKIDPLEKCALDYFASKKQSQSEKMEDPDLLFFKSLLPELHRMTNAQKHEFKYRTMQTLGEILYTPPPNHHSPGPHSFNVYSSFRPSSMMSNNSQAPSSHSSNQISTPITSPSSNDYDFLQNL